MADNSLAQAASPYLRSAMHQPVRWHEWGDEAFALAARENKPILLDIGAVWCHWCHVMDRESYENAEVAAIINDRFIPVKVDRDERPDVDSRYQAAVQAISGQGGWPLTAFLTPDGRPFYGGTYFPPDDHWGRPGFKRVLLAIADAFHSKQNDVQETAQNVMAVISQTEAFQGMSGTVSASVVGQIVASAKKSFDSVNGGFSTAPKFPHPSAMDLLIDQMVRSGDSDVKTIVETTLLRMAWGGVYDQLAGGFHRYSTDERWVVPHFEKMAYDNSELLKNYVHAYQATGNEFYADVARDIVRWMDAWLSDRERGGFYASQDADYSLEDDGDYFTWTASEAKDVLSADEFRVAQLYYDIYETGEMQHNHFKNVLWVALSTAEIARRLSMNEARVRELLDSAKDKLYTARLQRPTPFIDKTIYVGWNAMCISAYLKAANVLGMLEAREFALKSLDRVLNEGWNGNRMRHVIAYAHPNVPTGDLFGMLDDYAFTASACLDAYETTGEIGYFESARAITDRMITNFYDNDAGGFFDTELSDVTKLGALQARRKPFQDSPTPAGNSVAAILLFRMYTMTNDRTYREKAERTLEQIGQVANQFGIYAATYGQAVVWLTQPHAQVVVLGDDHVSEALYRAASTSFAVNRTIVRIRNTRAQLPPALANTIGNVPAMREGRSAAIVCSNFTCQPPITAADELASALSSAA